MACVETAQENADSEMEEGEIVDDLDDLSDISSEEEYLLRQRLQVLENYNNVLGRKKAKVSFDRGPLRKETIPNLQYVSDISATEFEDAFPQKAKHNFLVCRNIKENKTVKPHNKHKRRKEIEPQRDNIGRRDYNISKKKVHHRKRAEVKVVKKSSDESDDEYKYKRKRLAEAVVVHKPNIDKSSLQERLQKMLCGARPDHLKTVLNENKEDITATNPAFTPVSNQIVASSVPEISNSVQYDLLLENSKSQQMIDLCTDEESKDTYDSVLKDSAVSAKIVDEKDSDEDLELLRQHALKSKGDKNKEQPNPPIETKMPTLSEDEDSDTAELRLICLKSALLKKAIEMKQKQKLQKRLSQSSNLQSDFMEEQDFISHVEADKDNNTDIESVDMDMGSDVDDKEKYCDNIMEFNRVDNRILTAENCNNDRTAESEPSKQLPKEDELEEDEDLLRAKLLTSLSKNLPNLVDPSVMSNITHSPIKPAKDAPVKPKAPVNVPEGKKIIINVGESDSEGENEATKNLTKMHIKLSEQVDFQQKLDMFLKSTRMEVEKTKVPDQTVPKAPKFVAKAVVNLPKSEQLEYKSLVKRMAELEKIKQARQTSMSLLSRIQSKDTLKPKNTAVDSNIYGIHNIEELIASSRKKIAEESAKMLNLKEESTKLAQKYKIVATELRNLSTAITMNKKEQRLSQNRLMKIRSHHHRLLNSSNNLHSKPNGQLQLNKVFNKILPATKLQKENNPTKEPKITCIPKTTKATNLNKDSELHHILPADVDICNKKKNNDKEIARERINRSETEVSVNESLPIERKDDAKEDGEDLNYDNTCQRLKDNEYESPLQAFGNVSWDGDPNAILCPFEVGGNCKDNDCKYLHPKVPSVQ